MGKGSEAGRGSQERLGLRRERDSVCLYIIYRDIESVHACLAPQCPPLATPVHCLPPQGCLLVNLDSIQTTILQVGVGEEDVLIAVNRGRGQRAVLPPCPFSPLPMFCPWRRGMGRLSCFACCLWGIFVSLGDKRGGHQGSGKGTRGQDVLRTALYGPQVWYQTLPEPQGHLGPLTVPVPGPLQCPTWREGAQGVGTMYGADPTSCRRRRVQAPQLGFPLRGQRLLAPS